MPNRWTIKISLGSYGYVKIILACYTQSYVRFDSMAKIFLGFVVCFVHEEALPMDLFMQVENLTFAFTILRVVLAQVTFYYYLKFDSSWQPIISI